MSKHCENNHLKWWGHQPLNKSPCSMDPWGGKLLKLSEAIVFCSPIWGSLVEFLFNQFLRLWYPQKWMVSTTCQFVFLWGFDMSEMLSHPRGQSIRGWILSRDMTDYSPESKHRPIIDPEHRQFLVFLVVSTHLSDPNSDDKFRHLSTPFLNQEIHKAPPEEKMTSDQS